MDTETKDQKPVLVIMPSSGGFPLQRYGAAGKGRPRGLPGGNLQVQAQAGCTPRLLADIRAVSQHARKAPDRGQQ